MQLRQFPIDTFDPSVERFDLCQTVLVQTHLIDGLVGPRHLRLQFGSLFIQLVRLDRCDYIVASCPSVFQIVLRWHVGQFDAFAVGGQFPTLGRDVVGSGSGHVRVATGGFHLADQFRQYITRRQFDRGGRVGVTIETDQRPQRVIDGGIRIANRDIGLIDPFDQIAGRPDRRQHLF